MNYSMRTIGVGLGFTALIIMYLDRSALSYAITLIETTFHLSNADFGLISSAFGFGYIVMIVMGGVLTDRYGARRIWPLFAVAWSVACILLGTATGFWTLFIFRLLLGAAEAPGFPCYMRVLVDWFPPQQRARAFGVASSAVAFASVVGAPLTTRLIVGLNWRITFFILGMLGIIWAGVWYALYRDHPKPSVSRTEVTTNQPSQTTWKFLLFNPSLISNNAAFFVFAYVQFFALTWLPGYLQQLYGLQLKQVGLFLIAPWLTAGVFLILGGILSDKLLEKTQSLRIARSYVILTCQLLSALCFIIVIWKHSLVLSLIFMSLGIGFNNMPGAVLGTVNADLTEDRASTSNGIMNFAFGIASVVSPLITGFLSTWTGSFNSAIFLMIFLFFMSILGLLLFHHPDKR
ncbi:MAG TPA: MFS transporter [Gammaproteobacteria bacterium]|nr:MFS transporter [Gammaproteobacteria bacterium]